MSFILAYDLGTTGSKSCLYRISDTIELIDSYLVEYPLYTTGDGGAEQKADDWWNAVCGSTREIITRTSIRPSQIEGIAFSSQMQGSVVVDKQGKALRNPMIYMDQRSTAQIAKYLYHGFPRIDDWNVWIALRSLFITGGLAATPKDPLWKYHWVKDNEPEIFARIYKWLDVKDYLTLRCTGRYGMTYDSAHLTWVFDSRPGRLRWSKGLCRTFDVDMDHLPPVIRSTDIIGGLTGQAAGEMGLVPDIPVFGGGGDTFSTAVGSGALDLYDTHIYIGTSGWVAANIDRRTVDIGNFVASILGAIPGEYVYTAEQETSGICLQWVRDHLALDEIGMYLDAKHIADKNTEYESLYEFLNEIVEQTPPGAGGIIFTPWLHGNRSPREDPYARGMFFNLGLNTGKRQMIRAVLEGVAFHKRWMLEAIEKKIPYQKSIRFVGGGAKSDVWCGIMADITGRNIEVPKNPQNAGTNGAAIVCAVGLGLIGSFKEAKPLVPVDKVYAPRSEYKKMYDKSFAVFKELYAKNKKLFRKMNQ
ncbi:MAG: FGGY-family carbohydrate kinase [Deltaproteobacteria bacterium]|nr:FGGY-family carbohydrate kinase [Deltaproteobacteria bacterium]MCL5278236.1 FGGY-family carbohydrate kinase [Deltaproteobacteria bacterium]